MNWRYSANTRTMKELTCKCDRKMLRLYAVTDRAWTGTHKSLLAQVDGRAAGRGSCIQLREKDLPDDAFLDEARKMKALCPPLQSPFHHQRQCGTLPSGAKRTHPRRPTGHAGDGCPRAHRRGHAARRLCPKRWRRQSLHKNNGADYLGVGAMFHHTTKQDADAVSREELIQICQSGSHPRCRDWRHLAGEPPVSCRHRHRGRGPGGPPFLHVKTSKTACQN